MSDEIKKLEQEVEAAKAGWVKAIDDRKNTKDVLDKARHELWLARSKEEGKQVDKCRKTLEGRHGTKGNPKAQQLWDIAYSHGHSSGFAEIEFWYCELVELIQ